MTKFERDRKVAHNNNKTTAILKQCLMLLRHLIGISCGDYADNYANEIVDGMETLYVNSKTINFE